MKRDSNLLLAAAVAAVLLPHAQANAQGAALEEIIVTAERRAATEQTTSISMNVLSAEDLASTRTQNIADLQNSTPNVTINNPGGFNSINIRGIGNTAIQPSISVGVAVFQDGLLNAETITLSNQFLDLGTAEVLRGPQGTFVGASSTGGAIRLNSVKPDLSGKFSGYFEGVVGMQSDVKVTGAANLPISDTFAARIAFNQEKRNSYFYNRGTITGTDPVQPMQQPGSVNDQNGRVSLLWKPSDNFEAIWRSEFNHADNEGSPFQPNPRTFANTLGVQTRSRYWNYDAPADPTHDPGILSIGQLDTQFVSIVNRHSLELNYKFGNEMTLRSLTGLVHNETQTIEDNDASIAYARSNYLEVGPDNDYYSQEFNLISPAGPLNWIVGASWFYRKTPVTVSIEENSCGINSADGSFVACPNQFTATVPSLVFLKQETTVRSGGVFGQLNWKFLENLEATAGFRWNIDKNFSQGADRPQDVTVLIPAPAGIVPGTVPCPADIKGISRYRQINFAASSCLLIGQKNTYEEETPTWKVGLNWTPGTDQLVYAFWSRGYKSGGVDTQGRFEAEKVDDYELGWKGTFADGRAQLSLGGFYMNYANIQQQAYKATTVAAGLTVFNVGESTIKGIEAEFNGKFSGFGIQANVGWVDSKTGSVSVIDRSAALDSNVRFAGQDLPQCAPGVVPTTPPTTCVNWAPYYRSAAGLSNIYSPELSYSVSLDYAIMAGKGTWTPRIGFSHTDEQDTNLIKREAFYSIEKRDLVSASLTYAQNSWLVQAYCQNCTDETYIASVASGAGNDINSVVYGNPLNYGVRFRYGF